MSKLPVKVSPLIKATRWTLLISGIYYGEKKKKYLERLDKPLKVIRKTQALERHVREKKEKEASLKEDVRKLALAFGVDLSKRFGTNK